MELLTALVTESSALDLIGPFIQVTFLLVMLFYIALCWFFIAHKTGTPNAWIAFIPLVGMVVPWRVARAPLWSLIVGLVAAITFPLSMLFTVFVLFAALFSAAFGGGMPAGVVSPIAVIIGAIVLSFLSYATYVGITAWWAVGAAKRRGFSAWVGLLASPLTILIPLVGNIVRLVFLSILAFKEEPF